MLKILPAALLFFAAHGALAQSALGSGAAPVGAPTYCVIVGQRLEYGQDATPPVKDAQLAEDAAKVRSLNSPVAALNYMSSRGWECVIMTTVPVYFNSNAGNTISSEFRYLLRRRPQ